MQQMAPVPHHGLILLFDIANFVVNVVRHSWEILLLRSWYVGYWVITDEKMANNGNALNLKACVEVMRQKEFLGQRLKILRARGFVAMPIPVLCGICRERMLL